jgi:hypothetical protein
MFQSLDTIRDFVSEDPDFTFLPYEDTVLNTLSLLEAEGHSPEALRPHVERLVREAVEARLQEEATWPTTDCDRLNAAFAELEASGMVAHQRGPCCRSCTFGRLEEEIDELLDEGCEVTGYVFYSSQDTDSAIETGNLHLSFGIISDDSADAAIIDVGLDIIAALKRQGLAVKWDCNPDHTIEVKVVWKRRLDACARQTEPHNEDQPSQRR